MPEEGPMLKVPAPWPLAFRVYLISRSANDLALTEMMSESFFWLSGISA